MILHPRTQIIQLLIDTYNYKSYCELGVERGDTFLNIKCNRMVGVDPDPVSKATVFETSDSFFERNEEKFDIIFVDGLHEHKQVVKDLENSLKVLNSGGIILAHDCNPKDFWQARILENGYEKDGTVWCGSTWAGFIELRTRRDDLEMEVINDDWGIGIIKPGTQKLINFDFNISYEKQFEVWNKNKIELSNIIDVSEFMKKYIYV